MRVGQATLLLIIRRPARGAIPQSGRRRFAKRRENRRRMAHLRTYSGRNALQPAQPDQCLQREPAGPGLVLRHRPGRRQSGRHAAGLERHHLQHHQLEHRLRRRRAHGQGEVALGSGGQPGHGRPKICCGVVNRGVAIYQGKIIAPVIDGRLEALDAETGKAVWESRVAYSQDNYTHHHGAAHCERQSIDRRGGAEYPMRGFFAAYDAKTGTPGLEILYRSRRSLQAASRTRSCGRPPRPGIRNDGSWAEAERFGTPSPTIRMPTCSTSEPGNAGPWPEELRKAEGKENLYVASIIAREGRYGRVQVAFPDWCRAMNGIMTACSN